MERRQISARVRQWLCEELQVWRAGGILADNQAARIFDLYETADQSASRRRSLAMYALSGIATVMVGLAVLLLVSYNWQAMSATAKLAVIFGVLIGSYLVAAYLKLGTTWRVTSEMLFFLAGVFYGAAIWLIAQVFHIQSHYPDGIWFWTVGILPVVLYLDVLPMHALYAFLLALWVGTEILGFHGLLFGWFGGAWHWPRSAYTLPLLVLPGVICAYRRRSAVTLAVYVPVLAWWGVLQPTAWSWEVTPVLFVGLAGALLLLIAEMHRFGSRLAVPYRLYGVLISAGVLVLLSYASEIDGVLRHGLAMQTYVAGLAIALAGAVAALAVVFLQQRDEATSQRKAPFAAIVARQWLPLCLVLLLAGLCFWSGLFNMHDAPYDAFGYRGASTPSLSTWTPQILVPVAAVNVMMIALALWLMRVGLREDRSGPFAAGVLYFLLWAVLRYEDLFSGVGGMLGAAAMFLLCGVALLAVARLWMHRKENLPSPIEIGAGSEGGNVLGPQDSGSSQDALNLTLAHREREPHMLPGWLERVAASVQGRGRTLLIAGMGLQLSVLIGMIVLKAAPLWTGETVLLRVVPIDPRDMFRGDYVALRYDISGGPRSGSAGLPDSWDRQQQGKTVYALLKPEEDGKHWQLDRFSVERPAGGKFICGTITGWNSVEYGIESYYFQEGQGREYEEAARQRKLSAEVAIAPDGRAALRQLHMESPLASARPAYDSVEKYRYPTDVTYRAVRLPSAKITLDGRLDEPEWSRANVERHFVFPWEKIETPQTEFMAFCDEKYLYFAFRVEDNDICVLDKLRDKEDEVFEDRVELYFGGDHQMKDYYCLEIDSRGRVFDYRASYYRQLDAKWHWEGVEAAALSGKVGNVPGYTVEARIPLATLKTMGLVQRFPREKILCGLYRAEFSHDRSGKPVVQHETLHNRGRKIDGPPPIEKWISWIDPKTSEPDFHVPSSLGWLEIGE